MASKLITTWYLQYQGPTLSLPDWPTDCLLMEARRPSPELSQFLFHAVGTPWHWFSRLSWDYQQWLDHVANEHVRTWVLYQDGSIAGFVELNLHPSTPSAVAGSTEAKQCSVELKFFGLLPAFTGQGLGPKLSQAAIALAQQWLQAQQNTETPNIWVHTCSDDHPAALATYQRAGFVEYHREQEAAAIPVDYAEAALCRSYVTSRLARFQKP